MKKPIFAILSLLVAATCFSWGGSMMIAGGGASVAAGVGIDNVAENFEGTGYENAGWVEVLNGGTIDEDNASGPYEGSQHLAITAAAAATSYTTYTFSGSSSEIWVFVAIRDNLAAPTGGAPFLSLRDSDNNDLCFIWQTNGADIFFIRHGTTSSGNLDPAAGYFVVWLRYKAGTGANGELDLYYATGSETKPGSPNLSITTGTATGAVNKILLRTSNSGSIRFDHLRVSETVIGSNPP